MANRFITILRASGWRPIVNGLVIIAVLAALGYLGKSFDFEGFFKTLPFSNSANADWLHGPVGFVLFGAVAVSLACPRQIVSFFAAYFFGLLTGFLAALAATVLGCLLVLMIASLFKNRVRGYVTGRLDIALQFWENAPFLATVVIRFLPAGNNLLTNMAAGVFGIPKLAFITGSAIGYIPQTLVFAFVGSGVSVGSGYQLALSVVLLVISVALGVALYSRYRKRLDKSV